MYCWRTSKDGIILINYFHLKLKQLSKELSTIEKLSNNYLSGAVLMNICLENFLQIIINAYVAEFIFRKIPSFQQIFMYTFKWMRLNYKHCFLRHILL